MASERGVMKRFAEDFDQTTHKAYFGLLSSKNLCQRDNRGNNDDDDVVLETETSSSVVQ